MAEFEIVWDALDLLREEAEDEQRRDDLAVMRPLMDRIRGMVDQA